MTTVLLVDDEPALLQLLVEILGDEGYVTVSAVNGRAALEVLAEIQVDLVITDTMMPYGSGPDLIRAMREHPGLRAIPVILTSAAPAPDLDGLDVSAFLPKPFQLDELLGKTAAALTLAFGA